MSLRLPIALIGLLLVAATAFHLPAQTPADETLDLLGISAADREKLTRGDVVSYPIAEYADREIATGVALFVAAPVARVGDSLSAADLVTHGALAHGVVADPPAPHALAQLGFTVGERAEAQGLLDAAPGTRVNLSPDEIEAFRALRPMLANASPARLVEGVSEQYRSLLGQRIAAYREHGLDGIAPYARSGGALAEPAAELRLAVGDARRLARIEPELRETLLRYPAVRPHGLTSQIIWVKRQVQNRPAMALIHQMVALRPDAALEVERYFYVGHSYNSAQLITGAIPHADGTVVFSTARFFTEEVLGLGGPLKRTVGRNQLRDETRRRLERLRASVLQPVPRPAPPIQSP